MYKSLLSLMFVFFMCQCCVYPFEISADGEWDNLLSVEGSILVDSESVFVFTRTIALNDSEMHFNYERVDEIWVENEAEERYDITESQQDGIYRYILNGSGIKVGLKYRLCFKSDGKLYHSTFEKAIETPPIDSITYQLYPDERIEININSQGIEDYYFMWRYEEVWEDRAIYPFSQVYDEVSGFFIDPSYESGVDPRYICWKYSSSYNLLMENPSLYKSCYVKEKNIHQIVYTDRRISSLYCINVFQRLISKDEFTYWESVRKNSENTGGIFSQMPSELKGNIQCVDSPDETVLGYIGVSTVATERTFIYSQDIFLYRREPDLCPLVQIRFDPELTIKEQLLLLHLSGWVPIGENWSRITCTDCRLAGGTKVKPSYWPRDYE